MQAEIFADSLTPSCGPQGILPRMVFLREWRLHAGLTGEQLGAMLDPPASAGTISAYETGARNIGPDRLVQMAQALGTTPGKILDEPPPIEGGKKVVAIPGELIDLWDVMSPHARKQALALMKVIAGTEEGDSDRAQR